MLIAVFITEMIILHKYDFIIMQQLKLLFAIYNYYYYYYYYYYYIRWP